ncbi:cytochrome b [Cupriavidus plantarum]|uniref:Cytochrome b561 n=1 Tax=Cupriavidus plantarum TaxID=942865 RepID=A0A316EML8_9BURK|nr:cytochrome b [Cupriavidus plantarum]PWK33359.1 cytochrome b561 [Cupriavidus plantarum]REE87704.1 cytochrome b561 [Cupriavidus plantarum]RLK30138.1 cytochrome b561 [Cupriavidus plantarum]CAG2145394.1 Cytochrome b561 [Cupriavidus plantarum]SMR86089.1 cytochrome b561 [Cupriavidus plantarum]
MSNDVQGFSFVSRALHWVMAVLIVSMLFIGIGMVSTVSDRYTALLTVHRPIGIAIFCLAVLRVIYRLTHRPPPLPASLPALQRVAAHASHLALYALMLAMPLVGWGMQSAGGFPIILFGQTELPPILPHDPHLYAILRQAHTVGAFALFAVLLLHFAAALFHGLIRRDGVLESMTTGKAQ